MPQPQFAIQQQPIKSILEPQVIEGRYIEREKLVDLLNKTFGNGNFNNRLQLNRWIISAPRQLTEEEIDSCCSLE